MKISSILLAAFLLGSSTYTKAQTGKEWDDVNISSVNRQLAHTFAVPTGYSMSLDGTWKFKWVGTPSSISNTWCSETYNDGTWDNISVPSSWQVYGINNNKNWDKPLYCNVAYPFSYDANTYSVMAGRPGWFTYKDAMTNPVGTYRRHFTLPAEWDGREVYARFNGVGHGYYLWVNGQRVGYSEDSYTPSEFCITSYLHEGDNVIALQVYRFTSGSFLECQDYWRLTGIQRHCMLWSAPKTQIRDYFFTTDLDDTFTNATASIEACVLGNAGSDVKLTAQIKDNGSTIAQQEVTLTAALLSAKHDGWKSNAHISMSVVAPKLWSAEIPNLYDLVLTLKDSKGNTLDERTQKVGFREVSVRKDGALLINGQRMVFHGVDRHDISPTTGRYVSDEEMEKDILCMKRLNINAVRTSHYPNDPHFYELCDRYGIYVLAEANVECHANTGLSSVEKFRKPMSERSANHVRWYRNHACIFSWSLGNESGGGNNFQSARDSIKALDKTRLVHYEGNSDYGDVTSTMYASTGTIEWTGSSRLGQNYPKPHIQCENSHSMGNSMGNQREYFDLYEKYPALAGEFIWDFKDQGLLTKSNGKSYWAYGGDFGDSPNDGNFCINGVVQPDLSWTSKTWNVKKVYQPIEFKLRAATDNKLDVLLKSKLAFRSSDYLDLSYTIFEESRAVKTGTLQQVVNANDSLVVSIDVPEGMNPESEHFIQFSAKLKEASDWAEAGYEVACEKLSIHEAQKPYYQVPSSGQLEVTSTSSTITVKGENFTAAFSKTTGTLSSYKQGTTTIINQPLALNLFRLPTDNDGTRTGSWDNMGLVKLNVKVNSIDYKQSEDGRVVDITIHDTYTTSKSGDKFDVQHLFKVCTDGVILANTLITPANDGAILPKMGLRTEMPSSMEQLMWFGRGPWDSYVDRKESCLPGVYSSTVKDQYENYIKPQEHGTKQDVRWMAVTNSSGVGMLFVAPDQMAASAVHFRPEDNYTTNGNRARHSYEFKSCTSTVVNLDARTRGLGNASCGADVLSKYELKASATEFRYILMPLDGSQLSDAAQQSAEESLCQKARVAIPICQSVSCERGSNGQVTLRCATPGATIYYSLDGGETFQTYTKPFSLTEGGVVTSYASADGLFDSNITSKEFGLYINKSSWKIISFDSQQGGNEASKAIDGNNGSFWHTQYGSTEPTYPHQLVIDMNKCYMVTGFSYTARTDGSENGMVKDYEVYLSNNQYIWGEPVAKGTFSKTSAAQVVNFNEPVEGRYLMFVAKSEVNGKAYASASDISITASHVVSSPTPVESSRITSGASYMMLDVQSGLYLRYNSTTQKYELGNPDFSSVDNSFIFKPTLVSGFRNFYTLYNSMSKVYMQKSSGDYWDIVGGSAAPRKDAWIQFMQVGEDRNVYLRCLWRENDFINVDSHKVGSLIYCNKATPNLFRLLTKADATAIQQTYVDASSLPYYNLQGVNMGMDAKSLRPGLYIHAGRKMMVK